MQDEAIACAIVAIEKFAEENKITAHIKGAFEKKHSLYWHCICGRNFGGRPPFSRAPERHSRHLRCAKAWWLSIICHRADEDNSLN